MLTIIWEMEHGKLSNFRLKSSIKVKWKTMRCNPVEEGGSLCFTSKMATHSFKSARALHDSVC